ncbi:WD repeat protein [Grosmannia clavigera kw1407]|uniref:WD repeat protein n=1 Tax=Grosmannia clavigera (strain kw1407 / UAMH 11150) TaxID=655863 RepID=F0XLK2_GROCL|nr:WD repeat protein [Grosmannia clavigera kw1407]EFX01404.1 WD repeat protein [Grosmannia clavigera kw1407]
MSFPDKPVAQLLGANGPVHAVTYSAGAGSYVLTGSADRSVRLYNPQPTSASPESSGGFVTKMGATPAAVTAVPAGRLIQTYAEHGYEVLSLACAADNARFVSAGGDRTVFLWDRSSFAGDGDSLVVTAGFDTAVRIWDTRANNAHRPVQTLTDARDAVSAVAVRGPAILAASVDGCLRTYDARAGRLVTDVVSGRAGLTSLCLTRDGRSVLVGALDSRLRLFDRDSGSCLRTYGGPDSTGTKTHNNTSWRNEDLRVQSLLGGSERFVVAGDEMAPPKTPSSDTTASPPSSSSTPDGRVWAWDLLTGKVVATIPVPWGPPGTINTSRAIGRDGREKERRNVTSCLAWQDAGWGEQFCVGGTSGVVTVFGPR